MTSPAPDRYLRQFLAGWRTMDFNGHLANTAYLDLAADVRMAFFADHGFPPTEFKRLAIGPVVRKDELEYFREINLHEAGTGELRRARDESGCSARRRVRRSSADVTDATARSVHSWRPSDRRARVAGRFAHTLCYDRKGDIVESSRRDPVQKTTQQRKAESVERDRRSTIGETSKAARKGVARTKRHRNRAERRLANTSFGPELIDDPDAESVASARALRKYRKVSQSRPTCRRTCSRARWSRRAR